MALPPAIRSSTAQNIHPMRPAIRTTKANQAVGDWGLKRPLPTLRTQNITISDIDTQEHQTPFESSNQYTKVVQRWQEMGIPITGQAKSLDFTSRMLRNQGATPETVNKGIHLQSMSRTDAKRLIGKARAKHSSFLASQDLDTNVIYSREEKMRYKNLGQKYLGIVENQNRAYPVQSNGGLGYHPQGALSLFNTPDGPRERQLTARVLMNHRNTIMLGLGGIVSSLSSNAIAAADRLNGNETRQKGRAATVKVFPNTASFDYNGAIKVSLDAARPNSVDFKKHGNMAWGAYKDTMPGEQGYGEEDMEDPRRSSASKLRNSELFDLIDLSPVGRKKS